MKSSSSPYVAWMRLLFLVVTLHAAAAVATEATTSTTSSSTTLTFQVENDNVDESPAHVLARHLQNAGEPAISYNGMQLDLDYGLSSVDPNNINITYFEDEGCTFLIEEEDNTYLIEDVYRTAPGTIRVSVNIDPFQISRSRIIYFTEIQGIVNFCARLTVVSPTNPEQVVQTIDTWVEVGVNLTTNIGINELVQDTTDTFAIETFLCNERNEALDGSEITTKRQMESVRICVSPDTRTQGFNVVMRSIVELTLRRGDISQSVLVANSVIQNELITIYDCNAGDLVCAVEVVLSNAFFNTPGRVDVEGVAWIQYSFEEERRLREVYVQQAVADTDEQMRLLAMLPPVAKDQEAIHSLRVEEPESVQQQHSLNEDGMHQPLNNWNENGRQLQPLGGRSGRGFAGARALSLDFSVSPSTEEFSAEAYVCNRQNEPYKEERDIEEGNFVRVCFRPDEAARARGVYIREVTSFDFYQDRTRSTQDAVLDRNQQAEGSLYLCNAGNPICAVKTQLKKGFFKYNTTVEGNGEVRMQFGNERFDHMISTARRLSEDGTAPDGRKLQNVNNDPTYAGQTTVSVTFRTLPTPDDDDGSGNWWKDLPLIVRILIILLIILLVLLFCCCLYAMLFGCDCFGRKREEEEIREEHHREAYYNDEVHDDNRPRDMPPPEDGTYQDDDPDQDRDPSLGAMEPYKPPRDDYDVNDHYDDDHDETRPFSQRSNRSRGRRPNSQRYSNRSLNSEYSEPQQPQSNRRSTRSGRRANLDNFDDQRRSQRSTGSGGRYA